MKKHFFPYILLLGIFNANILVASIHDELKALEIKYGIGISTADFTPSSYARQWATWTVLNANDGKKLAQFGKLFLEEWNKYPREWIKATKLKGIVFVKNLSVDKQKRMAMPDSEGRVLYYDVGYLKYGEKYNRETIHHEFYHLIEYEFFGDFYYKDPVWAKFNPQGFSYGKGGASAYTDKSYVHKEHPSQGFVSSYSTYGLEEDKAEVYAYLFHTELYNKLKLWIKKDLYLAQKVNYLLDFIQARVSSMDSDYFAKIHKISDPILLSQGQNSSSSSQEDSGEDSGAHELDPDIKDQTPEEEKAVMSGEEYEVEKSAPQKFMHRFQK
jgi:hypothetical protein